ncbi:hypothetical protein DB31_7242 [Hyalangium minutum]|uniref:Uncharacterized protein n=1 Tax=Hyalangium minutum TaxID=394096 RepID=A0A085WJZ2_9BACT|nr:hypothetical protein DB31_7242 [Hyalangium minutum]
MKPQDNRRPVERLVLRARNPRHQQGRAQHPPQSLHVRPLGRPSQAPPVLSASGDNASSREVQPPRFPRVF